jgi:hypothetical protein
MPLTDGQVITPRGGPRLRRAALAAFNRVPGRIGRYNVRLLGDLALLSEVRDRGEVPLLVVGPGAINFMPVPGAYGTFGDNSMPSNSPISYDEMVNGYPFNRMAALWNMLAVGSVPLAWSRAHYGPALFNGTGLRNREYMFGVIRTFGLTHAGRPMELAPDFQTTFYGAASLTDEAANNLNRIFWLVDSWADAVNAELPMSRIHGRWRELLNFARSRSEDGASAPDVLADVGLEPEIWSSDTDPGGEGDMAGESDGDRDDDEPEFDEDGDEVPRPRRRAPSAPMPGIPRASFRDWERGIPELYREAEDRRAALRDIRVREQEAAQAARAQRVRELMEAEDRPECAHCDEGNCGDCRAAGRCAVCSRPLLTPEQAGEQYRAQLAGTFARDMARNTDRAAMEAIYGLNPSAPDPRHDIPQNAALAWAANEPVREPMYTLEERRVDDRQVEYTMRLDRPRRR